MGYLYYYSIQMKKILLSSLLFILVVGYTTFAYNFSTRDYMLINKYVNLFEKYIEKKWEWYRDIVINKLSSLSKKYSHKEYTSSIFKEISNRLSYSEEISLINIDTYQNKCFDTKNQIQCPSQGQDYFGQDSQYQSEEPTYKDNWDWTITDLNSGLMWQQDPWEKQSYYDAVNWVKDFELAWYDDWRVPTIKELYSLMNFDWEDIHSESQYSSDYKPFINIEYFVFSYWDTSKWDRIIDSQWVTSNIYKSDVMNWQECFFWVNFADGRIKCYPTVNRRNNWYYVIYVRWNAYWNNEFVDNWDWTISDKTSWLIRQKTDSWNWMDRENALSYCDSLELGWKNDWRLPNAKELQYIVDYSRSPDITNSPAINSIFQTSSITNEAWNKDYPYFWTSTTHKNMKWYWNAVYISFWRAMWYMNWKWIDVHWAGAQRSDPKEWDVSKYPNWHWPQWDAIRIDNYVRCVRWWSKLIDVDSEDISWVWLSENWKKFEMIEKKIEDTERIQNHWKMNKNKLFLLR